MTNKIYINHTDDVHPIEAIRAVEICLDEGIERGQLFTLSNGLAVNRSNTKNPSFIVWRQKYDDIH